MATQSFSSHQILPSSAICRKSRRATLRALFLVLHLVFNPGAFHSDIRAVLRIFASDYSIVDLFSDGPPHQLSHLFTPIFFYFSLHRRRIRVLELDPVLHH
jgi:hypothetical protein